MWIIVLWLGIMGTVFYIAHQRRQQLLAEGLIVDREVGFYEMEELFICDTAPETIFEDILKPDFTKAAATANRSSEARITFQSTRPTHRWNAQLVYKGKREEKNVFGYSLTEWHTHKGVPVHTDAMSMLLTSVEKVFLKHDPSTLIEERKMETKTRF